MHWHASEPEPQAASALAARALPVILRGRSLTRSATGSQWRVQELGLTGSGAAGLGPGPGPQRAAAAGTPGMTMMIAVPAPARGAVAGGQPGSEYPAAVVE